jgi:hypothetical protein
MFACQLRKLRWLSQLAQLAHLAHLIYPSLAGDRLGYPRLSPIQMQKSTYEPWRILEDILK